jgi:cellulose synthase/poly-beta-1,6-N-acetylglucosamine synthase-like glycosyltransferase
MLTWLDIVNLTLTHLEVLTLIYFLLFNGFGTLLFISAVWDMLQHMRRIRGEDLVGVLGSQVAPRISLIAPAYNEAATIQASVKALLDLAYPALELVVVNDGSKDETMAVLQDAYSLVPVYAIYQRRETIPTKAVRGLYRSPHDPRLLVVDKENGGKADALNVGLHMATGELVCVIDADTLIEHDALPRMVRSFLAYDDVLAVGATIRLVNGSQIEGVQIKAPRVPRRALAGFQVVEYLRAFLAGRLGWNRLGGNLIISGAFGLFRRQAMLDIGGYASDTVGEDMELVLRLRRHGYETKGPHRIDFIPNPAGWTEAPESLRVLGRQRDRWHRGLTDVMWRHRRVLFNPRYGAMGLLVYPYFLFFELLAPVIETVGVLGLAVGIMIGQLNLPFAIPFFMAAYGYGLVLSMYALVLEEMSLHRYTSLQDHLLLLLWTLLEPLGYRQLTVIWRLRGLIKFLRGRTDWGAMQRRGFQALGSPSKAP